jgi:hypothetical protein
MEFPYLFLFFCQETFISQSGRYILQTGPLRKRKCKAVLEYYNQDPEENCRNAIESSVTAAGLRPPTSGTIVAAGDLATWGVDSVASWSGVGEDPHSEER